MGKESSSISQEVAIRFINELKARGYGALPIYKENGNVKQIDKIRVACKGEMSLIRHSPTYLTNYVSDVEKEAAINSEYIWKIGLGKTEAEMQSIKVGDPVKHQLFGNSIDGNESIYEIMKQIKELSSENVNIYKASIPIHGTGTNKLDNSDKSNFDELMQRSLQVISEEKNVDLKNLKWIGAVRNIENYPHIQIACWDDSRVKNMRNINAADVNQIGTKLNKEYGKELCTIDCEKNTIVYQDNISGNDKFRMDGLLANIQEQDFTNAHQIAVQAKYKDVLEPDKDDEMEL